MAKFEEADPRWKVQDMGDQGRNVNNWFQDEFKKCFDDVVIFSGPTEGHSDHAGEVKCLKVDKCKGEAFLNRRKGNKMLLLYEFELNLKWEASIKKSDGTLVSSGKGFYNMPCIDTVEDVDKFEIHVKADSDKAENEAANHLARTLGVANVRELIVKCIERLKAEASGQTASSDPVKPTAEISASNVLSSALKAAAQEIDNQHKPRKSTKNSTTIRVSTEFNAPVQEIFECFTLPQRLMAFTQSRAQVGKSPGEPISLFDGSISGSVVECVHNQRLVWKWRQSSWSEGVQSECSIAFTELGPGFTRVEVVHSGIPVSDAYGNDGMAHVVEQGWKQNILNRIKMVFGYGVPEFH